MDTKIIQQIKAQLAVATITLKNIHNSDNDGNMSVRISLRDLVALIGVSDSSFKFLQENKTTPEYQARLEMVDHTLSLVGGILIEHHKDITMTTAKEMLNSALVEDLMSKRQSH